MALTLDLQGKTRWCGKQIRALDTVDSTNDEALRLIDLGLGHGTLVISEEQTAGHGRNNRTWHSPAGDNIYMTLVLEPKVKAAAMSMITLVMGMAVAAGVEDITGIATGIKWPNDVLVSGKKVCGILTGMIERKGRPYVYIGVGINVNGETFPEELAGKATSLKIATGKKLDASALAEKVLTEFERLYDLFEGAGDLEPLMDEYNKRLVNVGREVRILDPMGEYTGLARGINKAGELLVDTGSRVKKVMSGEVSVRGIDGGYI